MAGPTYRDHRTYLVHLLRALHERGPCAPAELYEWVAARAALTPEQRAVRDPSTHNEVYKNRIQFARQSLVDAGAVIGSNDPEWKRGIWALTEAGQRLATERSDERLNEELRQLAAEGARRRAEERKASKALAGIDSQDNDLPEEAELDDDDEDTDEDAGEDEASIQDIVDEANDAVLQLILEHVRGMNDTAFEHLVGTVLKAALRAESVTITQRSRDGGVDGVLHFDALGMNVAVFEAKRYAAGNVVGRALLDAFATAARRRRAAHKLFVTSSHFSPEARETARDEGIRLIEGQAFVELMARHGIGLRAKQTFVLYEVDPAWSVNVGVDED